MSRFLIPSVLAGCAMFVLSACQPEAADTPVDLAGPTAEMGISCGPERRAEMREQRETLEEAALAAARESRGQGSPALWKLSDEDTTIYLLGTVHLLRPEMEWMSPEIEAAILQSDTVVFEADTTSPQAQRDIMQFSVAEGLYNDGTQLTNSLTADEIAELKEGLEIVGLPVEALQPQKPWFAAINISVKQMVDGGFDPESGVEKVIERQAMAQGAGFAYLETIDQQLGGLARLDTCEQVDFLLMTADSLETGTEALDLLIEEWLDGDVHGLGVLMANPDMLGSQAIYDVMMTERNARWVPQITAMLDDPGTKLIAVGAAHLAGEDSVITMLRNEGYTVEGP